MCQKLFVHVKNYLSPKQHGFFPGRSINSNLLNFSEFCVPIVDTGGQVDVIYTDFEKAFDRVNHLSLLSRLNYFGVSDSLLYLFCSYLRAGHNLFRLKVSHQLVFWLNQVFRKGQTWGLYYLCYLLTV